MALGGIPARSSQNEIKKVGEEYINSHSWLHAATAGTHKEGLLKIEG
jgi:hypothetical protein